MRVFILLWPFDTGSASAYYSVQTMKRLPLYYHGETSFHWQFLDTSAVQR